MIPIDYNLYSSSMDSYGGRYGSQQWFLDPTLIKDSKLINDLKLWKQLGSLRANFGIIGWICLGWNFDPSKLANFLNTSK